MEKNNVFPTKGNTLQGQRFNRYRGERWDFIPIDYWPIDIAKGVVKGELNYVLIFRWWLYLIGNGMDPRKAEEVVKAEVYPSEKKMKQVENLMLDLNRKKNNWTYFDETLGKTMSLGDTVVADVVGKGRNASLSYYNRPQKSKYYAMEYGKNSRQPYDKEKDYLWGGYKGKMTWEDMGDLERNRAETKRMLAEEERLTGSGLWHKTQNEGVRKERSSWLDEGDVNEEEERYKERREEGNKRTNYTHKSRSWNNDDMVELGNEEYEDWDKNPFYDYEFMKEYHK
ncbi:MAG: hypothetical protein [Cressdnaviricota sp.]|nr:MAG: hypothetical protein [Cressdnaviricota sp.]